MDLAIIPECYIDTNFVETVEPPQKGYNHQKGCGTVAKVMKERFNDDFALGIIDKDKQELDYLKEFDLVSAKGNLELYKHRTKDHFIILVVNGMERFIFLNVAIAGIDLNDYGLPSDLDAFRKLSKTVTSKYDPKFKRLFRDMRNRNLADFALIRSWIAYLKSHPYNADLNALKAM
jgi:hypothetical protein